VGRGRQGAGNSMRTAQRPLWRRRPFRLLWAGQSISLLGSQVTTLALPLTAVFTLGATPAHVLGRMTATTRVIAGGTNPVGVLLGGALGTVLGGQAALVLTAMGVAVVVLTAWFLLARSVAAYPRARPLTATPPTVNDRQRS
jgi:hypothetical protein